MLQRAQEDGRKRAGFEFAEFFSVRIRSTPPDRIGCFGEPNPIRKEDRNVGGNPRFLGHSNGSLGCVLQEALRFLFMSPVGRETITRHRHFFKVFGAKNMIQAIQSDLLIPQLEVT